MAKRKGWRGAATPGGRDRAIARRRSRWPMILLTIVTAIASLALIVAGYLSFANAPR